jgi:catechol 2,3-dioxygenase-like lactoylglutathione lyase family enzyme
VREGGPVDVVRFIAIDHVQIAIPAGGEDIGRRFYGSVLGMTEVPKPAVLAVRGGAWFQAGSVRIHLGVEPDFRPARKAHPALEVDDLKTLMKRLDRAGWPFRSGETLESGDRIFADDPFGNRLEFMQKTQAA